MINQVAQADDCAARTNINASRGFFITRGLSLWLLTVARQEGRRAGRQKPSSPRLCLSALQPSCLAFLLSCLSAFLPCSVLVRFLFGSAHPVPSPRFAPNKTFLSLDSSAATFLSLTRFLDES